MSNGGQTGALELRDCGVELAPDPGRTIVRFFVPGREDVGPQDSRAGKLIDRILALDDEQVAEALQQIDDRFSARLANAAQAFEAHAELAAQRLEGSAKLGPDRRRLLGAAFTHEYSIEGAALCNPSMVRHPSQTDDGNTTFVLSVRGIGEGHRSSIGFRTGRVSGAGAVVIDAPGSSPQTGALHPGVHHRDAFYRRLAEVGDDQENAAYVLDALPALFDAQQLAERVGVLVDDAATRRHIAATIARIDQLAASSYRVDFAPGTELSDRVLWPTAPLEQHGMEDARFVEITDGSAPRYCATYTAFDGTDTSQNLLTTDDFLSFDIAPLAGVAARGKGLALFPRRVGGRYVALSRADRETNSVAYSDDLHCWDEATVIQVPRRSWELLQLGNCGSPIETAAGWLVLTHGVGPMRTYSMGTMLLDLDDPRRVIGVSESPIQAPATHAGYVPNVVYSCGAMLVGENLIVPYGIGDRAIAVGSIAVDELIDSLRPGP